jgi:uncharacterized protein
MIITTDIHSGARNIWYNLRDHYCGSYTHKVVEEAFSLLGSLWPYLVAGILITSIIKMFLSKEELNSFFNKKRNISVLLATCIGVISPLGSYVVVPLSASLLVLGTPLPVLMALLVSSPLIDPNLFILTTGAFGIKLALARVVSAFILGLAAGYMTQRMMHLKVIHSGNILKNENELMFQPPVTDMGERAGVRFLKALYGMTMYISKYFFIAIILAALIKILMPPNLMAAVFSKNTFLSVLFSTAAGVPFYVCGGAAIPVMRELADMGLNQGAILAFFIAGPITKLSNLILFFSIYRFRIFVFYILLGILGALCFGMLYNIL